MTPAPALLTKNGERPLCTAQPRATHATRRFRMQESRAAFCSSLSVRAFLLGGLPTAPTSTASAGGKERPIVNAGITDVEVAEHPPPGAESEPLAAAFCFPAVLRLPVAPSWMLLLCSNLIMGTMDTFFSAKTSVSPRA